jgi:hypothetical protein
MKIQKAAVPAPPQDRHGRNCRASTALTGLAVKGEMTGMLEPINRLFRVVYRAFCDVLSKNCISVTQKSH